MDQKDIHEMIAMVMESLREQTQTLAAYEGRIPQIEIDIVMSNLRKVYEYCAKLNMLNQGFSVVRIEAANAPVVEAVSPRVAEAPEEVSPATPDEASRQQPDGVLKPEEQPAAGEPEVGPVTVAGEVVHEQNQPQQASPDAVVVAVEPEPITNALDRHVADADQPAESQLGGEKTAGEPLAVEQPKHDESREVVAASKASSDAGAVASPGTEASESLFSAPPKRVEHKPATRNQEPDLFGFSTPTLADTLRTEAPPSVADRFAGNQPAESVASRLGSKVINDMKEAIGINDKFLLINELFKGNQHHYNQALHFLNNAESLDEAMGMFSRMFSELKWSDDSKAVDKLRSLIERRHGNTAR